MVKATEFWKYICEEMDYRLFSGVPCLDLKPLYDKMNPKFMHYIPAVNERVSFGIATGSATSGVLSGILVDSRFLRLVPDWFELCEKGYHFVIITNKVIKTNFPNVVFEGDYKKLGRLLKKAQKNKIPAIIVLKGDGLK